jgi:hypothetical protein
MILMVLTRPEGLDGLVAGPAAPVGDANRNRSPPGALARALLARHWGRSGRAGHGDVGFRGVTLARPTRIRRRDGAHGRDREAGAAASQYAHDWKGGSCR